MCKRPFEFLKGPIITEAKKEVGSKWFVSSNKKVFIHLDRSSSLLVVPISGSFYKREAQAYIKCIASKMSFLIFMDDFNKDLEPFDRVTETKNEWLTNIE